MAVPIGLRKAVLVHFTASQHQPAKIRTPRKVKKVLGVSHIAILEAVIEVSGRRIFCHGTDEDHQVILSIEPI